MIGVFDSGDGGLCTVEKIRELAPCADLCFLADRDNAPYGTKTRAEIIALTKRNLRRLADNGAKKVLIACCTASSVYPALSEEEKKIAIPIIDATAREAVSKTKNGKIGVIATDLTARSGSFEAAIKRLMPSASDYTEGTQELVTLIENGARDESIKPSTLERVRKILKGLQKESFDVLILGCTHFPRLEKTISEITERQTVSSALIGAKEIIKHANTDGNAINVFL